MRGLILTFGLALAACGAPAPPAAPAAESAEQAPTPLQISDPWATPTPGGSRVSAGYLTITSPIADRILSVSSPQAARVEIHEMGMDGDVMRMRAVEGPLFLAAGEAVTFAPGGLHMMFMEVAPPFAEGESVPVTLTFEQAGAVEVTMPVRRIPETQHGH